MEFGAVQCKPQNPDCTICPFISKCIAFNENKISQLPVKIKLNKVEKKYFNFLVIISKDQKTIFEKRKNKGIWQNLYQFPLIETVKEVNFEEFQTVLKGKDLFKQIEFELSLYNENLIINS